jgi:hypothetical protein
VKDVQKPDHVSLNTIINRLREGRFVIPDFQREFEWKPWDISELMRSIFLDYYIGSLLLWKGKKENFEALACEPVYGHPSGSTSAEHIVLDGQQRLTAMHYTFLAPDIPLPNRANRFLYFIRVDHFMDEAYDKAFEYDWTRRGPKLLNHRDEQFEAHMFPLAIIGESGWALYQWIQDYEKYWQAKEATATESGDTNASKMAAKHAANAAGFGEHLKGITEQYQIAYIELDRDLEVDKVCDIFTQINSRGVQLDVFDLINALLKPKGLQLKHLWRKAKSRLEFVDSPKMNVYLLQVMSILRQNYCSPKYLYYLLPGQEKQVRDPDGTRRTETLIPDIADFEKRWKVAVDAIESAINLLRHPQEFGAISSNYLPYVSILPVFSALQSHVKTLPANVQLDAQRKIRHWYWAAVFTNRYSGSVESTSARDFLDVKEWITDSTAEPALLLEFKNRFKNLELRRETKRGTSVYNGIFNLLVLQGARDWMTGNVPQHGDLDDHHIVPASWGSKKLKGDAIHTILNRTPLTAETNRSVIRDRLPNEYLPELIESNGEKTVRAILESHFISPAAQAILLRDPFTPDDFEAFIAERQRTLQDAIENLLVKERLGLPPQLRELDERIEQTELELRKAIDNALAGDAEQLPAHVTQKVDERIQRASKKNAALDSDYYDTLPGKLEFCDLRELQDTITGKSLWPQFTTRFANKEALVGKFGQLAELRNGIRHSRSVDEVTRKEGEAAILWFEQVLGRSA